MANGRSKLGHTTSPAPASGACGSPQMARGPRGPGFLISFLIGLVTRFLIAVLLGFLKVLTGFLKRQLIGFLIGLRMGFLMEPLAGFLIRTRFMLPMESH